MVYSETDPLGSSSVDIGSSKVMRYRAFKKGIQFDPDV